LKNELQQRDCEIESLLKELKLLKRKMRETRTNGNKNDTSDVDHNASNDKESSDEMVEDVSLTNEGDKESHVKNGKKIRYITEVQVKALEDEWIKRMRKKDNEIKKWKEKYRQYFQKNEMNRNLREDWKLQLEEMKKAVLLQQKMTETDKDRHVKELYERDLEIVRLKRLVAVFTRQNIKNYQKRQSYSSKIANENASIVRAPVVLRGGQRRREENVLRQMNIEDKSSPVDHLDGGSLHNANGSHHDSEKLSHLSDFKSDAE